MTALYQLPCTNCQKPLQVSVTQAGEELPCPCGTKVLVPTLREIKKLEVVADDQGISNTERTWTPAQGSLFAAGILLTAIGVYMHFRISAARDAIDISRPEFVELEMDIQELTPFEAWKSWENIEKNIGQFKYRPTPEFLKRRKVHANLTLYRYFSWALAAVGIISMISAFFVQTIIKQRRRAR